MKTTLKILGFVAFGLVLGANASNAHWSYTGENNPEKWGDIAPEFHACKYGKYQSPIDITDAFKVNTTQPLQFHYTNKASNVINNGHSIQVNFDDGGFFTLEGVQYKLVQVHFHTPSEFSFNGKHYPMVIHMVHQSKEGQNLVVAVMFEEGKENPTIKQIWDKMPQKVGETNKIQNVDVSSLVKDGVAYYRLDGSLTTPPCTEGVIWILPKEQASASKAQIEKFTKTIGTNNRPIQPKNGRVIIEN